MAKRKIVPLDRNAEQGKYLALAQRIRNTMKIDEVVFMVTKNLTLLISTRAWVASWFFFRGNFSDVSKGTRDTVPSLGHVLQMSSGVLCVPERQGEQRVRVFLEPVHVIFNKSSGRSIKTSFPDTSANARMSVHAGPYSFNRDASEISLFIVERPVDPAPTYDQDYPDTPIYNHFEPPVVSSLSSGYARSTNLTSSDAKISCVTYSTTGEMPVVVSSYGDKYQLARMRDDYDPETDYTGAKQYMNYIHAFCATMFCFNHGPYTLFEGLRDPVVVRKGFLVGRDGVFELTPSSPANLSITANGTVFRTVGWTEGYDSLSVIEEGGTVTWYSASYRKVFSADDPFDAPAVSEVHYDSGVWDPASGDERPSPYYRALDVFYNYTIGCGIEQVAADGKDAYVSRIVQTESPAGQNTTPLLVSHPGWSLEETYITPPQLCSVGIFTRSIKGVADLDVFCTPRFSTAFPGGRLNSAVAGELAAMNPFPFGNVYAASGIGVDGTGALVLCAVVVERAVTITYAIEAGTDGDIVLADTYTPQEKVTIAYGPMGGVSQVFSQSFFGTTTIAPPINTYTDVECEFVTSTSSGAVFSVTAISQVNPASHAVARPLFFGVVNGTVTAYIGTTGRYHAGIIIPHNGGYATLSNGGSISPLPGATSDTKFLGVGRTRTLCFDGRIKVFDGSAFTTLQLPENPYGGCPAVTALSISAIEGDVVWFDTVFITATHYSKVASRFRVDMVSGEYKVRHVRGSWHTDKGVVGVDEGVGVGGYEATQYSDFFRVRH